MKLPVKLPRRERPPIEVPAGEKVLAWTATVTGGVVGGTRDALYLAAAASPSSSVESVETLRIPWERVEAADWDKDTSALRVSEVGTWGEPRPEHLLTIEEPGLLLELVRERVTASVVLQRHVPLEGKRGVRVIARRAPRGDQPMHWVYEYDEGIDPEAPDVRAAAEAALRAARDEVGSA
ncbi:MAG TPA: hypothetical protein VFT00_08340 [Nocardioides sp.]|nr:hypothetical protein [Nocardioides sp.]